jgi:hypothetical protein
MRQIGEIVDTAATCEAMKVTFSTNHTQTSTGIPLLVPEETGLAPKLIKKNELAKALSVSPRTIDDWSRKRIIPHLTISPRLFLYDLKEVVAALNKRFKVEVR